MPESESTDLQQAIEDYRVAHRKSYEVAADWRATDQAVDSAEDELQRTHKRILAFIAEAPDATADAFRLATSAQTEEDRLLWMNFVQLLVGLGVTGGVFDSLSRQIEDSQSYDSRTRNVTYDAFTSYPATGFTFPNGRQTVRVHDGLYRRTSVADSTSPGSPIATWQFFGPSRVAEVVLANGLACTMMNNDRTHSAVQTPGSSLPAWGDAGSDRLGYDGSGRMIAKRFIPATVDGSGAYVDTTPVVAWTTAYDKASNKFFERELHAESRSHLYQPTGPGSGDAYKGYDSVNRLLQYQRGTLDSSGGGGGQVVSLITLPGTNSFRDYQLDHLGNWKTTSYTAVGDSEVTQRRQHNPLNQITSIKTGSDPKVDFSYDLNGNLLDDGVRLYAYDAFNRLIEVKRASDDAVIGTYVYDAGTRRVRKTVTNGGLSGTLTNAATDYIYNSYWQCVEERNPYTAPGSSSSSSSGGEPDEHLLRQYVWGIYIDELIQQREDPDGASGGTQDYYAGQDLLYRNTALTDDTGGIVEAYDTDAYGNTLIYDAAGTGGDWWADDAIATESSLCAYIFTGRRFDTESNTYQFRMRQYVPSHGTFAQRDPALNVATGYGSLYRIEDVVTSTDPWGMFALNAGMRKEFFTKLTSDMVDQGCFASLVAEDMTAKERALCFCGKQLLAAAFGFELKELGKKLITIPITVVKALWGLKIAEIIAKQAKKAAKEIGEELEDQIEDHMADHTYIFSSAGPFY